MGQSVAPPPGFVVDEAPALPPGFVVDKPQGPRENFFPHSWGELKSDVVGGLDNGLSMASAIPAGLGGGLGYLGTLAAGGGTEGAKEVQNAIQDKFTYQPRSDSGKESAQVIGSIAGKLPEVANTSGEYVTDKTGSPAAGAAANTAIQAIPQYLLGRVFGKASNKVVGATERAVANYKPGIKRTPEAQRMLDAGADLTPGQMNPKGTMNMLEQVAGKIPLVKELTAGARLNAKKTWQQSIANQASAPGAKITATDINEMAEQAQASYKPLYDQAKGTPVAPGVVSPTGTTSLANLFKSASRNKAVQADNGARVSTENWLMNKLTSLKPKPGKPLDSEQLIQLRSDIRAQIRKNSMAKDAGKNDSAELMQGAEQSVTKALESQLPPPALKSLQAADAKYGDYKVLEKAIAKAKDNPEGFSPENLAQAVKEGTSESAYAKGGGRLRQQSKDAKATLTATEQPTGAMLPAAGLMGAALAKAPMIAGPILGGGLLATSTRLGRQLAAGVTPAQTAAQKIAIELSKKR